jgi:hypothetical protein
MMNMFKFKKTIINTSILYIGLNMSKSYCDKQCGNNFLTKHNYEESEYHKKIQNNIKIKKMCVSHINISQQTAQHFFNENYKNFELIEEKYLTQEMCDIYIQNNGYLWRIPLKFQTEKIILFCVEKYSLNFKNIKSKKSQTTKICLIAVKDNDKLFKDVRLDLQTEEICLIAIEKNMHNIQYVRKDLLTDKIFSLIIKKLNELNTNEL